MKIKDFLKKLLHVFDHTVILLFNISLKFNTLLNFSDKLLRIISHKNM